MDQLDEVEALRKVLTDLGINFGAMIFLGFLTYQAKRQTQTVRRAQKHVRNGMANQYELKPKRPIFLPQKNFVAET